ncbi:AcrB/AcrD/AcrF family protein [Cylindrospermopsis raciborskii S07]|uniref:Efflux RND transporter permease subunit n=2 Tax=Cylindrospermopsis raciborskii TaxID=77022 RepID=A0A838WX18_9CYAN|nr:efflux RND transporter permease subunit [Cylindrospermopsis raciborskii]MBA4447080.1 efflux RND transporter permease subunit [Cylindrospermopsis raciborskii CS-506_C]MBA4451341.1 efflux RND transporter permease subunit [Cylindrospermopsis raciborskii CS-506_D]MBA4457938.1 efflux RND transporter permease subunit [Cylindrospermopsis raciborskii CS-506_B]MBA4467322.1 efflux RND transporter permease subunit [Cylindrospermopsis raciborskii CS-506_A]OHY33053.1 cation transporter [Cylindrospermops
MVKNNHSKSAREIFNISRWAIKFSWLTVCFWIGVTAAGLLAFSSLKYALFPDINFPVVVVNAQAPITSAMETEEKLTKPIETSLKSIPGIDNIRSSTYPGQSAISLLFAVGTNLEGSTQKTTSVLKGVKLPAGASYKIIPLNLNESSVVSYTIEDESQNLDDLHQLAKTKIVPTIENLAGVLKVSLLGAAPKSALPNTSSLISDNGNLIRFNGKDALAFQVVKRGDANTLEVVDKVEQEVNKLRSSLKNVTFTLAATQADYIREATQSTINALIEAIILAVVVIFPFLWSWRATLISALAIPISLLATLIVMAYFGFNLETITLLALALIIGSVIDDAIIDVENILRHIQNGQSSKEAAHSATDEIGLTVVAATATAIAVFLPIGLMGGVVGQFFKPFGITVSAAYIASTLVARTLSPVLSIYWLKPPKKTYSLGRMRGKKQGLLSRLTNMGGYVNQSYANLLYWSLNHRKIVILLAIVSFVAGLAIIPFIPKGFIPKLDRGEFNISYTAPLPKIPDLSALQQLRTAQDPTEPLIALPNPLQDSLTVAKKLEAVVRKYPDVETVFTTVGSRGGEPNKGNLYVKLKKDRQLKTAQLQDQLRRTLPKIPGVTTSVEDIQFVDTGGDKPLQVALRGNDLATLSSVSKKIKERIINLPGFADVTVTGDGNPRNQVLQIERLNQQRVVYISANLGGNLTLGDATDRIVTEAKSLLPAGVTLDLGGDSARQNEVVGSFVSTLLLSALCIILVLVLLFKSWVDPLVIGASLPLAVVGAMLALLFTKSDFGMISLIGFVFLLGQANKNAILLVDYINQLRRAGMERTEAILEAGPVRLRPIMITTFSTILGMMPIALGFGAGSELRSPMAIAIAGGLVTSTILSLVVVPVVYAILDDWFPRKSMN